MTIFRYPDGPDTCAGHIALPDATTPRAAVLVAHNWVGQGAFDSAVADRLASLGYVGIAIDIYGEGRRGDPAGDNSALMNPWVTDRAALRRRLIAAVDAAAGHAAVDGANIAIIGYCFGGLCALDLARAVDPRVKAAISFHGIYTPPAIGPQPPITAKVLALHGWQDPYTPPDAHHALAKEMTEAGADWQIHAYGHTFHSFTNPHADNPAAGQGYSAAADARSWATATALLAEVFPA